MKYYSEITKQIYDTEEELFKAEKKRAVDIEKENSQKAETDKRIKEQEEKIKALEQKLDELQKEESGLNQKITAAQKSQVEIVKSLVTERNALSVMKAKASGYSDYDSVFDFISDIRNWF